MVSLQKVEQLWSFFPVLKSRGCRIIRPASSSRECTGTLEAEGIVVVCWGMQRWAVISAFLLLSPSPPQWISHGPTLGPPQNLSFDRFANSCCTAQRSGKMHSRWCCFSSSIHLTFPCVSPPPLPRSLLQLIILEDYADPFDAEQAGVMQTSTEKVTTENDGYMEPYEAQKMMAGKSPHQAFQIFSSSSFEQGELSILTACALIRYEVI